MNKKAFTALFILASTAANVLMTLAIIFALVGGTALAMSRLLHIQDGMAYMAVWTACFLAGLVMNMFLFTRLTAWVIARFKLGPKLDERMLGRRIPGGQPRGGQRRRKTNLPDSARPRAEDEWADQIENSAYSTYQSFGLSELQARAAGREAGNEGGDAAPPQNQ